MQPNRRLSDFLPLKFKNGNQVKQFSKPCVKCGAMLEAKQMNGVARLVEDHIAIAATAKCHKCGEEFGVACVINPEKQVKRVVLPRMLFNWYLRVLPVQKGETAPQAMLNRSALDALPEARDAAEDAAEIARVNAARQQVLAQDIVRAEEAIGRFQDKAIPAWLLLDGCLIYRAKA